jgi:hypothetical protein
MFLEVSEHDSFYSIIFLHRQIFGIVELSIYSLSIVETSILLSVFEQIAGMEYFLTVANFIDGLKGIVIFAFLFLEFEHEDVLFFLFFVYCFFHLLQLPLHVSYF